MTLFPLREENFIKAQNRREPEAMSLLGRPPPHSACMGGISEKYLVQGQDSDKFGLQSHTNRTTDT